MNKLKGLVLLAALSLPLGMAWAETGPSVSKSPAPKVTPMEKIQDRLEYHKRVVTMIEDYLRDRTKIPAGYQEPSDKELLRKIGKERMRNRNATKPASVPAKK